MSPLKKPLKKFYLSSLQLLFAFYQVVLRPIMGQACRFEPTCSCYAHEAFQKHHPLKAFYLSAYRILRCQPFSSGGFDPVPEPRGNN